MLVLHFRALSRLLCVIRLFVNLWSSNPLSGLVRVIICMVGNLAYTRAQRKETVRTQLYSGTPDAKLLALIFIDPP